MHASGLICTECSRQRTVLRLEPSDWLRAPGHDEIDPGALTAIMDQLASTAIWGQFGLVFPHATISLNVDFVSDLHLQPILLVSRLVAVQDHLAHTALEARAAGTEAPMATGSGIFYLGSYASGDKDPDASDFADIGPSSAPDFKTYLGVENTGIGSRVPYQPRLVGSLSPAALHGGTIAAGLIHQAETLLPEGGGQSLRRVSVEYLKGARPEDSVFSGEVVNAGRRSTVISVEGRQGNARLIARALARYANFETP